MTPDEIQNLDFKTYSGNPDVIWTTHSLDDYNFYKGKAKKIVNIVHGGYVAQNINFNNNVLVKCIDECNVLKDKLHC